MRVLIVDDEPLAREGLRQFLMREPDVVVVGECGDGETALAAVAEHRPHVLFLDVQMPGLSGFDVVAALPEATSPALVFVTAHDRYAVRAFEECAADYLLKPVDEQRFARTLARLRTNLATPPPAPPFPVAAWSAPTAAFPERLMIGLGPGRSAFLRVADIVWIEAQDYCVEIHAAGGRRHLVRRSLEEMETLLDPQRFARMHRSALVNIDQVLEIRPLGRVRAEARLTDGTRVPVSRERLRALESRWPRLI